MGIEEQDHRIVRPHLCDRCMEGEYCILKEEGGIIGCSDLMDFWDAGYVAAIEDMRDRLNEITPKIEPKETNS